MSKTLLIKLAAREAKKALEGALSENEKIRRHVEGGGNLDKADLTELADNLYGRLNQVNEWLLAIQE